MCGITGKYSFNARTSISLDLIKKMTGILHHRGPDEYGIYIDDYIGLGHARLSIIDLSTGAQPIHNHDKSLWIVYNGEVFNYPELKKDLESRGHEFYTTSDTEVVLHLYEEKGPACLNELNGQFAIAIWDARKKELFLARDRTGIRPLFYTRKNNSLIFASEVKSIFMDQSVSREIDPAVLNQVFTFWTTLPQDTIFKDIYELPPGHYLKASEDTFEIKKYWDLPFFPPEEHLDWGEDRICEEILDLLLDATRIRLRADVPVGCYLSGGLDSSAISAMVKNRFNNSVKTFGIRFDEGAFDEGKHQELMVARLGTDHTEIRATNEQIGAALPDVLWHTEKPLLRTAPIPLYLLSREVTRQGLKVVLTGEGADEVFGGYNIFREAKVRQFWARQPDSKYRGLLMGRLYPYIFTNPRMRRSLQSFFSKGLDNWEDPLFSHQLRWQNTGRIRGFLTEEVAQTGEEQPFYDKVRQDLPSDFSKWDYLSKAQYLEISIFLSNYLLSAQGDRVAMANSLEVRLPYLDYRVMNFMGRVPARLKNKGLQEKYILKKAFEPILPPEVTRRTKHPYRAPIAQSLLHETNFPITRDGLSEAGLKSTGLFKSKRVSHLLKKLEKKKQMSEVDSMALVGILSTQLIHERFIRDFPLHPEHEIRPAVLIDNRMNTGHSPMKTSSNTAVGHPAHD